MKPTLLHLTPHSSEIFIYLHISSSRLQYYSSCLREHFFLHFGQPMGRQSEMKRPKLRKGLWSPEEDEKLYNYISRFGVGCWSTVPKLAGLERCGKSCRLRWMNYLRPDLKRGMFSQQEEDLIISLHEALGNRWAQISAQLPGRTDNEIKNFWNSCLKKKLMKQGIDPNTHKPISEKEDIEGKNSAEKPPLAFQQIKVDCAKAGPIWPCPEQVSELRKNDIVPTISSSVDMEQEVHISNTNYFEGRGREASIEKFGSKPNFDPPFQYEIQGSYDPFGCNSNFSTHDPQNHLEGNHNFGFASVPALTDFSDNSGSIMSSFSFNEVKQSSSNISDAGIVGNNATVSWEKLEPVFGFQFSGIKYEEIKPSLWPGGQIGHNSEAFSSYPLITVSENLDFSSKY
ncbi:hypothetical protein RHMOL_Rhmol12G0197100 [Rhododendron molle]|uniref:Uncharacterized protein n=1 Tax=Rhododendron molle TaxID=49168 RepID=A0ACC0LKB6_RHOML|nr:hypothetical protein RHMOL_Rhmol12G0197100 [Rhododendron molle]